MKYVRTFVLCSIALLGAAAGFRAAVQSPVHVVIMHTNDIHGQILPRDGVGGLAEIATIIRNAKPDLLLDAGDIFTGTYLSDQFKGAPAILAMNAIGYTAGTIGNHEFDYGQDVLRMRLAEAKFPVLSANLETGISEIRKHTVVTAKGIRFGIIGVTTEEVGTTTHPRNLQNVRVHDVVDSIRQSLKDLEGRADFVIVTAHVNDNEERRIAAAFPDIRLIVGGHNHAALGPIRIGQTLVVKTGSSGRNVGRVDLEFDGTALKQLKQMEGRLIPVQRVAPDAQIAKIIEPFETTVAARLAVVVGEATGDLATSREQESSLGNLVADAMRIAGKTQIGFQNIGGIRARIRKGPITWGSMFEVLPFQNTLVTLNVTGAQLKRTLNIGLFAVSGLRVRLDLQKRSGQRLVAATLLDGSPIDDRKTYSVTTNDFIVAGGDGLSEFGKGQNIKDTGIDLREAVVDYLKTHRPIAPALDGRIRVD